jgi:hypothetical protein
METEGCFETLMCNCQDTRRRVTEDRNSDGHRVENPPVFPLPLRFVQER